MKKIKHKSNKKMKYKAHSSKRRNIEENKKVNE